MALFKSQISPFHPPFTGDLHEIPLPRRLAVPDSSLPAMSGTFTYNTSGIATENSTGRSIRFSPSTKNGARS